MKKIIACMAMAIALSGCACIVDGSSQQITVNTNPPGATCVLTRNMQPIATITPTPSSVLIQKTKHDINIVCSKEGYQDASYFNHSGIAGSTWGNIILGGPIGWAIDSSAGADNKYDSPVNITLVPAEADEPAAEEKPAPKKTKKKKDAE